MERMIVNTLKFNMSVPTPYCFMRRFLRLLHLGSGKKVFINLDFKYMHDAGFIKSEAWEPTIGIKKNLTIGEFRKYDPVWYQQWCRNSIPELLLPNSLFRMYACRDDT